MGSTENLSNNLMAIRRHKGLSQIGFAQQIGISKSTLQALEQGHSPRLDTVEYIAAQLNTTACTLISDTLPPGQSSVLSALLHHIGHYTLWEPEDQDTLLELSLRLVQLVSKYTGQALPDPLAAGRLP